MAALLATFLCASGAALELGLRSEVRGRTHLCRLDPGPLASAHQWLRFYERFWTDRLEVLERLLRTEDARPSPTRTGDDP